MIRENASRGFAIHDLWERGRSIDNIASETGIPRSTVGYYVRKFNKSARKGEPITTHISTTKKDERLVAVLGVVKHTIMQGFLGKLNQGDYNNAYQVLLILKLVRELQGDLVPTDEENDLIDKNMAYVFATFALSGEYAKRMPR